jgi:glycerol-3-phosphate acyltransferase PlsX
MPQSIAIDVMGGDVGPNVTIPAAIDSLKRHPKLQIILVGNEDIVKSHLLKYTMKQTSRIKIRHATEVVLMDESPQIALKNKKDSSMRVAINLIKSGEASACKCREYGGTYGNS